MALSIHDVHPLAGFATFAVDGVCRWRSSFDGFPFAALSAFTR